MSPNDAPSLVQIRKQSQELRDAFSSSVSSQAEKIRKILSEFDDFAENYGGLWNDISTKIAQAQQNVSTAEIVDARIAELWLALKSIVNQYQDPVFQPKVEDGMKFLEELRQKNPDLFPVTPPSADVLIFIKEKGRNIARRYPYSNTFLIGISAVSANVSNDSNRTADWRPIAHELGHYLYWNSCFGPKNNLKIPAIDEDPVFSEDIELALKTSATGGPSDDPATKALTALMISWSEEIFADLVGTRLLGRDYAASAKDLFIELRQQKVQDGPRLTDDIDHPIPYLRPYVVSEGLRLVEDSGNRFWTGFKAAVESLFGADFETSQDLLVGLFSADNGDEAGFEELPLDVSTVKDALKIVIPIIYGMLQTKEVLTTQPVGIELIKARVEAAFVDSYVDISDVLEKGDRQGLLHKGRRRLKDLIKIILKRNH